MKPLVAVLLAAAGLVFAQQAPSKLPPVKFTDTTLDNLQIIAVGDASKIGDLLKKFGPVEVVPPDPN